MPRHTFTYLIGYIGFTPQYFQLEYFTPGKLHPKHTSPRPQQNLMLTNRRRFYKIHRNNKKSNNYEGNNPDYKR